MILDNPELPTATNWPELRYHVILSEYQEKGETMAMELVQYLDQHHIKPDFRGLIFCRTIAQAAMFEETFDILAYHSDKSDEERTQVHQRWYAGAKIGDHWMATTTFFIHGIDYPFVDFIVFVGCPYNFIHFIQASARGGRAGQPCMVFVCWWPQSLPEPTPPDYKKVKVMQN